MDNKLTALDQPLENGQMVEIVAQKDKTPNRDWLKSVRTNLARNRIKNWLKKHQTIS